MGNSKSSEANGSDSGADDGAAEHQKPAKEQRKLKKEESVSAAGKDKEKLLSHGQREVLKFCMSNAKDDFGHRVFLRTMDKKDDFRVFAEHLSKEERKEMGDKVRDFLLKLIEHLADPEEMDAVSRKFGEQHAQLRAQGFKPDFFVGIADALTTECVFLDGATHGATETLMAWSLLTAQVFSAVRDGYYAELRRLRRISATSSTNKDSSADDPVKDEDAVSSKSSEQQEPQAEDAAKPAEAPQFLAPPNSF